MEILVTGATGFIGREMVKELAKNKEYHLKVALRTVIKTQFAPEIQVFSPFELIAETNWQEALSGTNLIIHAAARVHVLQETGKNPLNEFRKINVEGTLNLARQAAFSGVKRFIFISSIGVNGKSTLSNSPFTAEDLPNPHSPYAISKFEAEQQLQALAAETGMDCVIIRPPLVYGPNSKGNFQRLLTLLQTGLPLPLGAVYNKRSFVSLENLLSLILLCVEHPRAANQIFLVSDDEDLSTTELLKKIGKTINKPVRLIPIPQFILAWICSLLGKKALYERLCASLQINLSKTKEMLDWEPKKSLDEGLKTIFQD
ncbi:MAG: NAD-dependent epimerase/dehydratase family protein [Tatlockia sp.]|nr:NAD-dependent epimerase/dehydratase family protein [Tatlockia sp.]